MDEDVKVQLLRITGRISALEMMVHEMVKTCPGGFDAARAAITEILASADAIDASGKQDTEYLAMGLREGVHAFSDSLD